MASQLSSELNLPVDEAARLILGAHLTRVIDGRTVVVKIVETEAYDQTDEASHTYRGMTPRTEVMFGKAGVSYVYFTYGMHYCFNVVTGPVGHGSAVLIRAVEPISGVDIIIANRSPKTGILMTNGPAKVCQALQIDRELNKHNLSEDPFKLMLMPELKQEEIVVSTRIGITKAIDQPWRFYIASNPYVSKL